MEWIQTYTGMQFHPGDPSVGDFDIRDVAHGLALLCRFNGHCRVFYSVAEHSVRVSRACPPEAALAGLLHDLGEAYLGDLPRPIKRHFPEFDVFEDRLLEVAAEQFGLPWPLPDAVWAADDLLLATEFRDLMEEPPAPLRVTCEPLPEIIEPQSWDRAEAAFLERFEELTR